MKQHNKKKSRISSWARYEKQHLRWFVCTQGRQKRKGEKTYVRDKGVTPYQNIKEKKAS